MAVIATEGGLREGGRHVIQDLPKMRSRAACRVEILHELRRASHQSDQTRVAGAQVVKRDLETLFQVVA